MSEKLFDIEPTPPTKFCRTCVYRERHQYGNSIFQYCVVRKSNRTLNKKLKIKCKTAACELHKE